jgi:hypothetical protein
MLSTSLITCALIAAIRLATERHGWLVPAFPQLPMSERSDVAAPHLVGVIKLGRCSWVR